MPARFNASSTLPFIEGLLYRMNGRVDVGTDGGPAPDSSDGLSDTNVELTIEPGVIVYASGSSFLNVNRGNTIEANGTADRPIIFTSRDNVQGLNTDSSSGQWGGVVLSGRAPVTDCIASGATPGSVNLRTPGRRRSAAGHLRRRDAGRQLGQHVLRPDPLFRFRPLGRQRTAVADDRRHRLRTRTLNTS